MRRHLPIMLLTVLLVFTVGIAPAFLFHGGGAPSAVRASEPDKADKSSPAPLPPVSLPDVTATPGELSLIDVSAVAADSVSWQTLGPAPKNVLPQYQPGSTAPYALAFSTNTAGQWWVVGAAVKGGQPFVVRCTVTVGAAPPTPPQPPTPSTLTATLQAAYNADSDSDKAASLAFLQNLYYLMATGPQGASKQPAGNSDAWTKWMQGVAASKLMPTQVANLRKAIATEVDATFGHDAAKTIQPADMASELKRVSDALSGVK